MKRYIAALLAAVMLCFSTAAFADVSAQSDQISAYMDSTGGITLTGYTERINATDAYELVTIDAGQVVYMVENEAGGLDLMSADFETGSEKLLVSGVKLACGYDGEGLYYVLEETPSTVNYITYDCVQKQIYTSEEEVEYLQRSHYGLMIGFDSDAGAVVYDETFGLASAFNGITGVERRLMGDCDLVLTEEGELYLDDPTASFPALISAEVEQFEAMNGYVYYIRVSDVERTLMQYSPDTLSWQYVLMDVARTPISLTTSYTQALIMDDTGTVYSINDATCAVSPFASITAPENVAMTDVFIDGVSGQINVYSAENEQQEYILAFNFNFASDSGGFTEGAAGDRARQKITLLASCELENEANTFDVLTPAKLYEPLSYGRRGEAVTELQQRLTDLGYLNDKVDGIFGPRTRYAVMLFQDYNGFDTTGVADRTMQELLFSDGAPVYDAYRQISYGARGLRVTAMQERLRYLGYMADPADGIYGPYTRAGVKLFQQENGLRVTGTADRETLVAMYEPAASKCSSYFEMNYGDSGWRVQQLNRRLKALYYLEGTAGSSYNSATKAAVKKFQRECGLTQSGVATAYVQQRLFAGDAPEYSGYIVLRRGDENDRVVSLQARLRELGYFEGKCTGYFGKVTQASVKAFQRVAGLEVTGVATIETQELLYSSSAPRKPVIAEITVPVISVSNVIAQSSDGLYHVEDTVISVSWTVEGLVSEYYVEITDSRNRVVESGYISEREIRLDISAFTSRETFKVTVYAVPDNGTINNAKSASVYIVIPERAVATPTPAPTPVELATIEPTPEVTATPGPQIELPVINVSGDFELEGNTHIIGDNGTSFNWTAAANTAYSAVVTDDAGNVVYTPSVSESGVQLFRADLVSDANLYLVVTAYPAGGDAAQGKSVRIMVKAGEAEPDPTETPVEVPVELSMNVSGADKIADVWYIGDTPITVSWVASGNVTDYTIELIDYTGTPLSTLPNVNRTSIEITRDYVAGGGVYGLRVTANSDGDPVDATIYMAMKEPEPTPTAAPTEMPVVEATETPAAEATETPAAEATETPVAEVTEAPVAENSTDAEPSVEPVSNELTQAEVIVNVENAQLIDGVYMVAADATAYFSWSNTGDATEYSIYLDSETGNILQQLEHTTYTEMSMDGSGLPEIGAYCIRIVAHTSGGDVQKEIYIGRAAAEATPEPVYTVSAPYVSAEGYADFDGSIYYMGDAQLSFSWSVEGELAYYNVYLYDEGGNCVQSNAEMLEGALTLDPAAFAENTVYSMVIAAVPVNGTEESGAQTTVYFARPASAAMLSEEPAEYSVGDVNVTVSGYADYDGAIYYVGDSDIYMSWYAEGDLAYYNLYLYDGNGELVNSATEIQNTELSLGASGFVEGVAYQVVICAVPVNGSEDGGTRATVTLMKKAAEPAAEPEEQTEEAVTEPEPEAQVGQVSAPVINVSGYADFDGSVYYVGSDDIYVSWSAQGDVAYYNVYLSDGNWNPLNSATEVNVTELSLSAAGFEEGATYYLAVNAIPVNGTDADCASTIVAFTKNAAEPASESETQAEEPAAETEPEAQVGQVSAPVISVSGSTEFDGSMYWVGNEDMYFSWYAEGDVASYSIYLTDNNGNLVNSVSGVTDTQLSIALNNIACEMPYYLQVVAVPVNGTEAEGASSTVIFFRPEPQQATEPEVQYSVSAPEFYVEGYSDFDGSCYYIASGELYVSWNASGDLSHYNIYLYDGYGNQVNSAMGVSATNMSLSAEGLEPNVTYTVSVEAVPVNGTDGSGAWGGIAVMYTPVYEEPTYEEPTYEEPAYEEPSYEEPTYEEPAYEEPAGELVWDQPLNMYSDYEHISAYQQRLVEWGWLIFAPDGMATEGVFDQATMDATLALQNYINSLYAEDPAFMPLELITVGVEGVDPYVGVDTLQLIMPAEAQQQFINPEMQ